MQDARLCVSVVSHGHGGEVRHLLGRLAALRRLPPARVIVTLNLPDADTAGWLRQTRWPFELLLLENPAPRGFGANHNRAFAHDSQHGASDAFAVLNPDIDWADGAEPLAALHAALHPAEPASPSPDAAPIGLAYPVQTDAAGRLQDHERLWPTPARLWRRYRPGRRPREVPPGARPDWVNAAFVLLPHAAYAQVGGFDETYHMYCEDVDLCLRLQAAGWRLSCARDAQVIHGARRASHRHPLHLLWHVQSLWRLWRSAAWQHMRARERTGAC
ncbi:MAG: glycosyl transferase [Pseudomonadota bacterium]|nr:glycosyl transferase [Pseudomonadota bacterium]